MRNFISPHVHQASFDSASTCEKFCHREIELDTGHTVITDHGTLEGTRKLYDLCHKGDFKGKLKPIIGMEAYVRDDACDIFTSQGIEKDEKGTYKEYIKYMHLTMHMMDQDAFSACSRLLSKADDRAETHGSERKPLFAWSDLEELGSHNITFGSSCLIGMVGRHLLKNNDVSSAVKYYERLRSLVKPGNFFVEVFPHVCESNYEVGIFFQYEDGTEEKFPVWKKIKTKAGEFKAEQIANEFKNDSVKLARKHQYICEVINYRKWTAIENPKPIKNVYKKEGFLKNECSPQVPNGDVQLRLNKFVMELAAKYGDKILISDDSHFVKKEEHVLQEIRLNQRQLEQGLSATWKFSNHHFRLSTADAKAYFDKFLPIPDRTIEEWIENSYEWAAKFDNFKFKEINSLPVKFYPQDTLGHTLQLIEQNGRMDWNNPQMVERLKIEIERFHKNGTIDLLPYFFIDKDVVDWYAKNGVLTGPGRGSGGGVLLLYLEGITHVNPLKYELSLDRFLTPDRIALNKMPDIDQDLPHRNLLVDPNDADKGWLKERFGDCVAQISTETTLKLKSSIKDVFRSMHGEVPDIIEKFCKTLPVPPQGVSDKDFIFGYDANGEWTPGLLETSENLREFVERYPKEWDVIKDLVGLIRGKGRHAAGFLISNEPISNHIPLTTVGGVKVTQFNLSQVEAMGGIKMDFLVVEALNDIQEAIKLIQDRSNCGIDWSIARKYNETPPSMNINGKKVPYVQILPFDGQFFDIYDLPDDYNVYNSICEGDTDSVFQFNTDGAKEWLHYFNYVKQIKDGQKIKALDSIMALANFTALDRPGGLDVYVKNHNGSEHNMLVEYSERLRGAKPCGDPELNKILMELLPETLGICVYQEGLSKIFKVLGNTTGPEAEEFRSHISKKQKAKVLKDKEIFMRGATSRLGLENAEKLWSQMEAWSRYGFCKAHAIEYVHTSYATAFLKHHFPLEWWTAVLKNADRNEINEKFWGVCGHLIDVPDVQESESNFAIKNNRIKAPLSLLHGIGDKAHQQLSEYAPYSSIQDFCEKVKLHMEKGATLVEKEVKDKRTGLLSRVTKKKLGRSALNSKVMNTLIVSGAMDSLFPKTKKITIDPNINSEIEVPLEPVDKILMFQTELARITGKKLSKKKFEEFDAEFKDLSEMKQFQLRKKVLPSYKEDITGKCLRMENSKFFQNDKKEVFFKDGKNNIRICGKELIQAFKINKPFVELNLEAGASTVAYVISERRFTFGDTSKKMAIELIIDVEGERLKIVQWPDYNTNTLPDMFNNPLAGSVVVLTLAKKKDKIKIKNIFLVESGIDTKLEEESAEEESNEQP